MKKLTLEERLTEVDTQDRPAIPRVPQPARWSARRVAMPASLALAAVVGWELPGLLAEGTALEQVQAPPSPKQNTPPPLNLKTNATRPADQNAVVRHRPVAPMAETAPVNPAPSVALAPVAAPAESAPALAVSAAQNSATNNAGSGTGAAGPNSGAGGSGQKLNSHQTPPAAAAPKATTATSSLAAPHPMHIAPPSSVATPPHVAAPPATHTYVAPQQQFAPQPTPYQVQQPFAYRAPTMMGQQYGFHPYGTYSYGFQPYGIQPNVSYGGFARFGGFHGRR